MWTCRALLALVWLGVSGCAVQTTALRAHAPEGLAAAAELSATPFFPQTDNRCGPAALATALSAIGIEASPAALSDEVFLPAREGSLQTEMLAGARRHGAVATQIPATLESVLREVGAGHVVVVLQNLGLSFAPRWHYAVVVGYDLEAGEIVMRSGETQRETMAMRTFEYTWARSGYWAFVALPPGEWPVTAQAAAAVEAAVGFERVASDETALSLYEGALARWPDELSFAIGLGNAAYAKGDKLRAAQVFRGAAVKHDSAAAWINLGTVLLEQGERKAAAEAATHALGDAHWAARARELLAHVQRGDQATSRP